MSNPAQRHKEFWDLVNDRNKVSKNILLDRDVKLLSVGEKKIIMIRIPEAGYQSKPVFINGNPYNGTFRRNYEGDYHCTEEEVRAMIRDSSDQPTDGTLLENYGMQDIDLPSLQAYRRMFNTRHSSHPYADLDDLEFLKQMGGFVRDRRTGQEGLSTAGLLMFGKGLSIRECFPGLSLEYISHVNALPHERWTNRLSIDGTWENNLFSYVRRVLPELLNSLQTPFSMMDDALRSDETDLHDSVREAFINMVIHADYQRSGMLKAEQFNDGFLFSNPGELKIPVHEIFEGGHTACRNLKIQIMFRMIGYCENIGSGFPVILKAWKSRKWRDPDLHCSLETHTVELRLWQCKTMPQEASRILSSCFGSSLSSLTSDELSILAAAALETELTVLRAGALLRQPLDEVKMMLGSLSDRGMLKQESRHHKLYYSLNPSCKPSMSLNAADQPSDSMKHSGLDRKLSSTDKILLALLEKHHTLSNQKITESVSSITTVQGAAAAMNRLIQKGLVRKAKSGRTSIYTLADPS